MSRRIVIDPVTRIEGHAKITIHLDDSGNVAEARFHVTEFRGFEKFCEGRLFWEMPGISARICGICPVSHILASSKAGDHILGVAVPPAGEKLRRLMNLAQIIQSHALGFFHLSSPDLLLGFDSPPASRNLFGLAARYPDVAKMGIRMRQFGQEVIGTLGGRKIHPSWGVPGGVRDPLDVAERDQIRARVPEQIAAIQSTLQLYKDSLVGLDDEVRAFGELPTLFLALVGPGGEWEHYDGHLRLVDANRQIVEAAIDPQRYGDYFGEAAEPWSYLKFPYYQPLGYPAGSYRVGPLARLNVCERIGSPLADRELAEFRTLGQGAVLGAFHYHYARLIEILASLEAIERLLDDPDILSSRCRAEASVNRLEGVGVSEAPRGTLFHHYRVDPTGRLEWVNLLIATGQNNLAMNQTVAAVARHYVRGGQDLTEGVLNRIEASIRAYDPCLSCSTHAIGQMPLLIQLIGPDGQIRDEARR
ncbi:MAG TPA: Ni/Fe hydrogenase subunit alpha [Chloroflexota bacterium]|nr:Ni/Fe hydrogenase subunit alpha [Chloroflexota bacterium]